MPRNKHKGVTFVENAIVLPIALAIVFLILWFAYIWFCRYNFNNAVADGVRSAAARGAFTRLDSTGLINRVYDYQATGGAFPGDLFSYQVPVVEAEQYLNQYETLGAFDGGWFFKELPGPYLYSMVYMNQALKKGVGRTIKFPCDPEGVGVNDGPGCVSCQLLHPDQGDTTPWLNTNPADDPPRDRVHYKCRYQPDTLLIRPMAAMLRMILGNAFGSSPLVFEKQQVLRWYSDCLVDDAGC